MQGPLAPLLLFPTGKLDSQLLLQPAVETSRRLRAVQDVGKKNVEVTFEDQQQINAFSKLSGRQHELQDILKVKSVRIENFQD